jgi:hypothetical protein
VRPAGLLYTDAVLERCPVCARRNLLDIRLCLRELERINAGLRHAQIQLLPGGLLLALPT